jgi:hypothetical protein
MFAVLSATGSPSIRPMPRVILAGITGALPGIELEGGIYTYFGGDGAAPEKCQAACRADEHWLVWDYVRPGIFSPDAPAF